MSPAAGRVALGLAFFGATVAFAQQTRDTTPRTGTATISGIVVATGEAAQPIRRAIVTLSGPAMIAGRSAITGDDGRFVFTNLPAGRYGVVASKAAYLDAAYGATRPRRPGITLALADAATRDLRIEMARGAVLEGLIRDQSGQPLPDGAVYAVNVRSLGAIGASVDRNRRTFSTDDRGVFRIFGLAPGEYVVAAALPAVGEGTIGARDDAEIDAVLARLRVRASAATGATAPRPAAPGAAPATGFPLTYFPGVSTFSGAARIRVAPGEERVGLDFTLAPVRTTVISGSLVRADGQPPGSVILSLAIDGPRTLRVGTLPVLGPIGDDGQFAYTGVHPGRYTIYARGDDRWGGNPGLAGVAEVEVSGADVTGIAITLRPGIAVAGRVAFDGSTPTGIDDALGLTVRLRPVDGGWMFLSGGTHFGNSLIVPREGVVQRDGTFVIRNVALGRFTLSSALPPQMIEKWWLRSAMFQGRDLLDGPVEIGTEDLAGLVLTYTDRRNELAGSLATAAGLPAPEYFVVAIPEERALWPAGERRTRFARPASDGSFSILDLPAGRYLIGALTDFEPEDLEDPAFLEQLAAQAVPVVIRNGEQTVQNLRIAR